MDISVVLPTWNRSGDGRHAGYLEQCLDSIWQQEFDGTFEVLIGTEMPQRNGSMLLDVIETFRPEFKQLGIPLKVLIGDSDPESGHGPTDNDLYAMARGKYVTRPLGDDELYRPNMLQALWEALEAGLPDGESSGLVLAYGDFEDIDANGKVLRERRRGEWTNSRIMQECFVGICVLIHRGWFRRNNFKWSAIKAGEDWDMWKRMGALGLQESRFVHVPEILGQWRDWSGTLTQSVRKGEIEAGKDYTA